MRYRLGWSRFVVAALWLTAATVGPASTVSATSIPSALVFTPVTGGLSLPVFVTNAGDGSNRLFIVQQGGQVRIFKNGSLLPTPFLNIAGSVPNFTGVNGEQGLLCLVFDPNYSANGIFYITYTTTNPDPTFIYTTTLARYHVSTGNPDVADASSGVVLLSIPKKYTNHNGGMIAFGPDGYLYMSMGDGGSGGDPDNNAQNLHTLLGKLLRLDVESTPPPGKMYVIPPTNPFFGSSDPNVKQEIWAYGLRNPWRFSFDRLTGDLYIGDVGQNIEEEVDFQAASSAGGQNYGWHILEANLCYDPSVGCVAPTGYVPPVATYDHGTNDSFGCALTGGYVYRGSNSPSLQGVYFYGDYCSGKVLGLVKNANNTWSSSVIVSTSYSISSFGQDEQGELYLADYGSGTVYEISSVRVSISGSAGIDGATLSYTDGIAKTVTSAADGSYSFTVSRNWSGTVTPSKTCYTFNPVSISYTNLATDQTSQNYTAAIDPAAGCADVTASVAGITRGTYEIAPHTAERVNYPGIDSGPVKVQSTNAKNLVAAERDSWWDGKTWSDYAQLMGLPAGQVSDTYVFPAYNNVTLDEQLRFGNVDTVDTTVTVTIGGIFRGSYLLHPSEAARVNYAGLDSGPVVVQGTPNVKIIAAERDSWWDGKTWSSYAQLMGLPAGQVSDTYVFPAYNNVTLDEQLRFGNVDTVDTTVTVTIGGVFRGSYLLHPNQAVRVNYTGVDNGPVVVQGTPNVKIIAAERDSWWDGMTWSDFNQLMGLPASQVSDTYVFPAYNNVTLDEQLRFGNVDTVDTTVTVTIGGIFRGSYLLHPSEAVRVNYAGVDSGPVVVQGTPNVKIIAAERDSWWDGKTWSSFVQMMGLPATLLSDTYMFPAYNNITLDEQLRFGVP